MAGKLPPIPVGVPPGHSFWNDWYEKLRSIVNELSNSVISWAVISDKPTTVDGFGITDAQKTTEKNSVNGYAGLNGSSRTTKGVDTTDDVIVDLATKGLVLKDTQGTPHYWRITINTTGTLITTDLGTTKP